MASRSEMVAEDQRDAEQWGHRVIRALHEYRNGRSEESLEDLRDLVNEKNNLEYSYEDIDPAGVSGITDEDIDILREIEKNEKKANLSEKAKNWAKSFVDAMETYHAAIKNNNVVERASAYAQLRTLLREKIKNGYSFDYLGQSEESGVTDEDREWLDTIAEKMAAEEERE